MVINSLSDVLNTLTAFLCLFFAFFLLTIQSKNRLSNVLIAIYLIIIALDSATFITSQLITLKYPGLGLLLNTLLFLGPPILYMYIRSVCYYNIRLELKHLLHAIPFVLAIVILIPGFYLQSYEDKIRILKAEDGVMTEMKLVYLMLHIQTILYVAASYIVVLRSKKLLLENYSGGSTNHFKWLISFLTILSIEIIVSSFKNYFLIYDQDDLYYLGTTLTGIVALLFICWLVLQALRSPELYGKVASNQMLVKELLSDKSKESTSDHDIDHSNNIKINSLLEFMDNQKPFLDSSLSIYDLAKRLEMPSKELSILINHHLNKHFFDFVNEYRIREAMKLLSDEDKTDLTVLEILYAVGFNSKSSFNTAFKKLTGQTPTQYRNAHK